MLFIKSRQNKRDDILQHHPFHRSIKLKNNKNIVSKSIMYKYVPFKLKSNILKQFFFIDKNQQLIN